MTAPIAAPLPVGSVDHEIWRYLLQLVAIGQHRGTWDSAAVVRVAEAHLSHPRTLRRALLNERQRADGLAETVEALREKLRTQRPTVVSLTDTEPWEPPAQTPAPLRVVVLSSGQAQVLALLMTGASDKTIAEHLGITASGVINSVSRIVTKFDAESRVDVVIQLFSGAVMVRVRQQEQRRAA